MFENYKEFRNLSFRICFWTSVIIRNCQSCAKVNTPSRSYTFLPFVKNGHWTLGYDEKGRRT